MKGGKRGDMLQRYLEHLINSIEKKRKVSIKEFHKTDLNRNEIIESVNCWYENIVKEVKNTPPTYYVRTIEIAEDSKGKIKSISYIYFEKDEELFDSTFVRKTDYES